MKIMYQNCCKKCGSVSLHTEVKGSNTGLYCDDCGAFQKWLGKDELRAFEYVMREATKDERKSVDSHIQSVSQPTGVSFYDFGLRKCKGKYYQNGFHNFDLGYFHQWGCNYEDNCDGSIGNFSVAIVELPNGEIVMPVANDIEFIDHIGE